jgi:hypothetical protein
MLLRILMYVFFGAVVVEGGLMIARILDPVVGLGAMAIGLFFGGVMHALAGIQHDLTAMRERALPGPDGDPELPVGAPGDH